MSNTLPQDFDPDCEPTSDGVFGLPTLPDDAALVLIPAPWEATVSYRGGTSRAPAAIRSASRQVEIFDAENGRPYEHGIAMTVANPALQTIHNSAVAARRAGDTAHVDQLCAEMSRLIEQETRDWYAKGKLAGVIGGEHSVCVGAIRAAADEYGELSVLQVDAHADLRTTYQGLRWNHACTASSILRCVPGIVLLSQVGVRDLCPGEADRIRNDTRIETVCDWQLHSSEHVNAAFLDVVDGLSRNVWITFDIDGLDPSLCPNTGTPVPGGLSWREVTSLIRHLGESGRRIVGFDLCEVSPGDDVHAPGDNWDAIVGARILYKLCGWCLRTMHRSDTLNSN